ncbi:aminoglycoside adenylyltransferase domain-containing protein [Peribacillus kribbensis]|uniref:aminoglycoside adenylyltransferase domain-containing protein n=1 Tax=Peribacillus kribbensis TaxID=356658 RepID=UPI0004203627|nr:aminoglycoside adenylyltransferase domain-containing protein [Peribacillus kribbensis]
MAYNWDTCPPDTRRFVSRILHEVKKAVEQNVIGFYIHGSLAMGGFNPKSSDIDILVITADPLPIDTKIKLAEVFLFLSNRPYPVEVSFMNEKQVRNWLHPSPFDFHYSEAWRERYETDPLLYLSSDSMTDPDLAAHLTITAKRGVCMEGKPIEEVIPSIPAAHYISAIMEDFHDCLERIEEDPIYSVLNLIRVFWYLKEGKISSKQEAGCWAAAFFPEALKDLIKKVVDSYENEEEKFEREDLLAVKSYIYNQVQEQLKGT